MDKDTSPFGVSEIYLGTSFDYNNDRIDDHIVAYSLYAQFEFVIFDGKTFDILSEERVMMYFKPENLTTKIYIDENQYYLEWFSCKLQIASASEQTETIQIIKNNDSHIFEAVYDSRNGEFLHAYDVYQNYDGYIAAQKDYLEGYDLFIKIDWCMYEKVGGNK